MKELTALLSGLVAVPSVSGNEDGTARLLAEYLSSKPGIHVERIGNNVVAKKATYRTDKPVVMLCSHHDTVAPAAGYTRDPFTPSPEKDRDGYERLYGLGSNDAGASVVTMTRTFCSTEDLPFNLLLVLAAGEETSAPEGILSVLPHFPEITCALVGEPTGMRAAVGEKGLLVLDGTAAGRSGHAALGEGVNALYAALDDIALLRNFRFSKESPSMGHVHLQVTQIHAGSQHNVIPDLCRYVVDVRTTDAYTNAEILNELNALLPGKLTPRNMANKASATPAGHPLLRAVREAGIVPYISPTSSDWMRLACPALKIGPGCSSLSHAPDEFIYLHELEQGVRGYQKLLSRLVL